jgi:IPT/TIG domain-containing protein
MPEAEHRVARLILNSLTVVALLVALFVGVRIATEHSSLPIPPTGAQTLVFSPDGATAYVVEHGQIGVERLNAKGVTTTALIDVSVGTVTHLVITPDGHELVAAALSPRGSGAPEGALYTIDLTKSPAVSTLVSRGTPIDALAMAPNGAFALVGQSGRLGTDPSGHAGVEVSAGTIGRLLLQTSPPSLAGATEVGYGISALAVAPSSRNAFVVDHGSPGGDEQLSTLHLSGTSVQVLGSVPVQGAGLLLAPNGFKAFVGGDVINTLADPPQLLASTEPPHGIASLNHYTVQSITPDGRFVYLSGGQLSGDGGVSQVVEDTSTTPPTATSLELTDCTNALVNPQGTAVYCGAGLTFPIVPSISALSVHTGGIAGGYKVVLTGSSLSQPSAVTFGPNQANILSVSRVGSSITVSAPAGRLGTVPVFVTTAGGTNPPLPAATFTYTPSPAVTGITPNRGLIQGGTDVLLAGSGFTSDSTVDFGSGNPGRVLNVSPNGKFIAVTAPAGVGSVNVTVTSGNGSSAPTSLNRFHFVRELPVVLGVRPASGPASGGYGLLIGGRNLNGATAVHFGSTLARRGTLSRDGDYLSVIVPPGAGTVDVTVTTPSGTSNNRTGDEFTYEGG